MTGPVVSGRGSRTLLTLCDAQWDNVDSGLPEKKGGGLPGMVFHDVILADHPDTSLYK